MTASCQKWSFFLAASQVGELCSPFSAADAIPFASAAAQSEGGKLEVRGR
eukprot:NODE_10860_length_426_cov_6.968170_g9743_i0.p1 GENE.NODE_10860_length_426_cov_6.968170_g9743_i0~~NODE_10860_length_426_cov_6.968170_g9743_i0.p1  ORF type:complete len:50 (+),score=0.85 NODE_10860_length_426_cov_6.968170_g9743_i0:256-405(+)